MIRGWSSKQAKITESLNLKERVTCLVWFGSVTIDGVVKTTWDDSYTELLRITEH
jgi:hypothetical protein